MRDLFPSSEPRRTAWWPLSSGDMGSRTQDSGQLDRNLIFPEIQIFNVADLGDGEYCLGSPRKGSCRNGGHPLLEHEIFVVLWELKHRTRGSGYPGKMCKEGCQTSTGSPAPLS